MTTNRILSKLVNFSGRIYRGWWLVVAGGLINAVAIGIFYQGFTVFFLPLKRELALTSAAVSLIFGASRLEGGIEGPLVGYLINRFGPRRMIIFGSSLAAIGYFFLSRVDTFLMLFIVYVLVIAMGASAGFTHPVSTVINNWFIRRRGNAFGIFTAAGSFGGVILVPVLSHITLSYSWRTAAVFSGCLILAIGLPASLIMHRTPEEKGLEPDGLAPPGKHSNPSESGGPGFFEVDFTVKEALRMFTFWLLSLCISLRILVTTALSAHMIPLLVWKGMDEAGAAYLVGLSSFLNMLGMLMMGWISDRFSKPLLCSFCLVITGVCLLWPAFSASKAAVYMPPVGLAVSMSTIPLNWSLIGDFFGRQSYATLRGITIVGVGFATFISPIFAGWVFDATQSYTIVLVTFSGLLLAGAALFAILRAPVPR